MKEDLTIQAGQITEHKKDLVNLSEDILKAWQDYSDESLGIYAYSKY